MYSFQATKGTVFHYNSDFSGSMEISDGEKGIELPARDIVEFVMTTYIRRCLEENIEQMIDALLETV